MQDFLKINVPLGLDAISESLYERLEPLRRRHCEAISLAIFPLQKFTECVVSL